MKCKKILSIMLCIVLLCNNVVFALGNVDKDNSEIESAGDIEIFDTPQKTTYSEYEEEKEIIEFESEKDSDATNKLENEIKLQDVVVSDTDVLQDEGAIKSDEEDMDVVATNSDVIYNNEESNMNKMIIATANNIKKFFDEEVVFKSSTSEITKKHEWLHGYDGVGARFKSKRNNQIEEESNNLFGDSTLPTRYDAREEIVNGMSVVSPVKNQVTFDCGAHATTALIETSIRKKGLATTEEESDISELALMYNAYHLQNITNNQEHMDKPGIEGNDYTIKSNGQWYRGLDPISLIVQASSYMGFVVEDETTKYNYTNLQNMYNNALDPKYAFKSNSYVIANAEIIDKSREKVKKAIMENGSVQFPLNADHSATNTKEVDGEWYYYSDDGALINHTLVAVGWDDNVPASNFRNTQGRSPSGNGAWLCKNSWGTDVDYHKDGFFWLSYEDQKLGSLYITADVIRADTYKYNYHYDTTLFYDYMSPADAYDGGALGNVFKVSNDEDQKLEAVNVATGLYSGNSFNIKIYTNSNPMSNPIDGTLQLTQTFNTDGKNGIFTIPLDSSVFLTKGTYYSIVIESTSNGSIEIYLDKTKVQAGEENYNEVKPGQSFYKTTSSSEWKDYNDSSSMQVINGKNYGTSLRIKGLANPATDGESGKTLSNITITNPPTKVKYKEGEKFDPTGLAVSLNYTDNTSTPVTYGDTTKSNFSFTPSLNTALTSTNTSVTVKYNNKATENPQAITVISLQSIEVDTSSTARTSYAEGEKFNPAGLVIKLTYSDGTTTETVAYSDTTKTSFTFSPSVTTALAGTNTAISITYKSKNCSLPITVKAIRDITISNPPTKVKYKEGEKFDPTGLKVSVNYTDNTSIPITYDDTTKSNFSFTPSLNTALTSTNTSVTVKYNNKATENPQAITVISLQNIEVDTSSTARVSYAEGEKFNPAGLVIKLVYSDGTTTETVAYSDTTKTSFTFSPSVTTALAGTNTAISITYKGKNCSLAITVKAISNITISNPPTKVKYKEGEKFDPTGLAVSLNYNDNTSTPVTYSDTTKSDFSFTPSLNTALTSTNTSVTVKYNNKATENPQAITVISLQNIEVDTSSTVRVSYAEGEKFNPAGLVIKLVYSDGTTTETVAYSDTTKSSFAFSPSLTSALAGTNTAISITYKSKNCSLPITVKAIRDITISNPPTKVRYKEGEKFDPTGLVVSLNYTDNTSTPITYSDTTKSNFSFTPSLNTALTSTITSVTIKYNNKATLNPQTITVVAINRIEIDSLPTKREYTEGDRLDASGLVVSVVYEDNSTDAITYGNNNKDLFAFNNSQNLLLYSVSDEFVINMTYCGYEEKFTVKVNKRSSSTPTNNSSNKRDTYSRTSGPMGNISQGNNGTLNVTMANNSTARSLDSYSSFRNFQDVNIQFNTQNLNWSKDVNGNWQLSFNNTLGLKQEAKNSFVNVNSIKTINGIPTIVQDFYLFDNSGKMFTGWLTDSNNKTMYFETVNSADMGKMIRGWKLIQNKYYYFDNSGYLVVGGTTPDGYVVDSTGAWVR